MKSLTSTHYFLICCLVGAAFGTAGFFGGEKSGVKKGAVAAAWIAKSSLDSEKDMLLIIEDALVDGQHEAEIRRLIAGGLEKYLPVRTMLVAEPFSQPYDRFEHDRQRIEQALQRLRTRRMELRYEGAEPGATDNPDTAQPSREVLLKSDRNPPGV